MSNMNDNNNFNDGRGTSNQYGSGFSGNQDPSTFDSTATYGGAGGGGGQNLGFGAGDAAGGMGQSDWGSTNPTGNMGATGNMGQSDWGSTNTTGNMGGQTQGWIHNQGSTGGADFTGGGQFQGSDQTAGDFGSTGTGTGNAAPHVSTGDKVRGTAEKLIGKATKNPELVERGQDRSSGASNNQF